MQSSGELQGIACLSLLSAVYLYIQSHAALIPVAALVMRILATVRAASFSV